eukprot:1120832-Pleurochrysis_carterae.AAC.1
MRTFHGCERMLKLGLGSGLKLGLGSGLDINKSTVSAPCKQSINAHLNIHAAVSAYPLRSLKLRHHLLLPPGLRQQRIPSSAEPALVELRKPCHEGLDVVFKIYHDKGYMLSGLIVLLQPAVFMRIACQIAKI